MRGATPRTPTMTAVCIWVVATARAANASATSAGCIWRFPARRGRLDADTDGQQVVRRGHGSCHARASARSTRLRRRSARSCGSATSTRRTLPACCPRILRQTRRTPAVIRGLPATASLSAPSRSWSRVTDTSVAHVIGFASLEACIESIDYLCGFWGFGGSCNGPFQARNAWIATLAGGSPRRCGLSSRGRLARLAMASK